MKTNRLVVSVAVAMVAAFLVLFLSVVANAQIRQIHLYIDDGSGHFTVLSAPPGGGLLTFPAGTGTLLMADAGFSAGVALQPTASLPGTQQTGFLTISGDGLFGGSVGIGTTTPNAALSFGTLVGSPAIYLFDDPTHTDSYGFGINSSEMQSFIPSTSHFSWNAGGALQPIGTNELMRLDGSGNLSTSGTINTSNAAGYELGGLTVLTDIHGGTNIFAGYQAGSANLGFANSALGWGALFTNTNGNFNTASGAEALYRNTTGANNTASGYQALYSNTTGGDNTASGYQALYSNTTGGVNSAIGEDALFNNTSGSYNAASGFGALYDNTTGQDNTASGAFALEHNTIGNLNTATGGDALGSNTTGSYNTGTGVSALQNNTTGSNNTAEGLNAAAGNQTASGNSAFGVSALQFNITGSNNTAVGMNALINNASDNNTAVGSGALQDNTAANNTAVGTNALIFNTSGNYNTAIGYNAAASNATGTHNTFVGYSANAGTDGLTDATAIGANSSVAASHEIQLGATTVTLVNTSGAITSGDGTNAGAINITDASTNTATLNNANHSTATFSFPSAGGTLATSGNTVLFDNSTAQTSSDGHDLFNVTQSQAAASPGAIIGSTSTGAGATGLTVTTSGSTGASGINVNTSASGGVVTGLQVEATGGANNFAILVPGSDGYVGIGNSSPTQLLSVGTASALTVDGSGNLSTSGTITSTSTSGITSGSDSHAGALLISDGSSHFATINDPNATNAPVFNLPAESGAGPFTLATTNQVLSHIAESYTNTSTYATDNAGEQLLASGTDAAISIALQPKGTGALEAQIADNATAGGNIRGHNAVDWQMSRTSAANVASGNFSTIGGGVDNDASGDHATIAGGGSNSADGSYNTIGGGASNAIGASPANYNTIAGGQSNAVQIPADHSTIGGGNGNTISGAGAHGTIAGGFSNTGSGQYSSIGGGSGNSTNDLYEVVAGGQSNSAAGSGSVIGGGVSNVIGTGENYSTISGGKSNVVTHPLGKYYSVIAGGENNTASGTASAIGGGSSNTLGTTADFSAVPGGELLTLNGNDDFGFLSGNDGAGNPMTIAASQVSVFGNTDLWLANNDNAQRAIKFFDKYNTFGAFPNTSKYVGFEAPDAVTTSTIWKLPVADGAAGSMLRTDGSGNLSWSVLTVDGSGNVVTAGSITSTLPLGTGPSFVAGSSGNAGQIKIWDGAAAAGFLSFGSSQFNTNNSGLTLGAGNFTTSGSITSSGAGGITSGTVSAHTGSLTLANQNSANATTIQAGNATSAVTYVLPTADGSASQVLQTDGGASTGNLSWVTVSTTGNTVGYGPGGASNTDAAGADNLFNVSYNAASTATAAGAVINSTTTGTTSATGLTLNATVGTSGSSTATGLAVTATGGHTNNAINVNSGALTIDNSGDLTTSGSITAGSSHQLSIDGSGNLVTSGSIQTGSNFIVSTEGPIDGSSNAATVSGDKVFAEVNGAPTGNVTITITDHTTGQILYLYNNNTNAKDLLVGSQHVPPGKIYQFIYYGTWLLMNN